MQEKIALYEEILQQDPGARIFYPLARMYFDAARLDDALAVLDRGLASHHEHLGAMLLRLEILDEKGSAQAEPAARVIAKALIRTPSLWRLWSRQAAGEGQQDLALALRFVAGAAGGDEMTWSGLLAAGMDSFQRKAPEKDPDAAPGTGGTPATGGQGEHPGGERLFGAAEPAAPMFDELSDASDAFAVSEIEVSEVSPVELSAEDIPGDIPVDEAGRDEQPALEYEIIETEARETGEEETWIIPEPSEQEIELQAPEEAGRDEAEALPAARDEVPAEPDHEPAVQEIDLQTPEEAGSAREEVSVPKAEAPLDLPMETLVHQAEDEGGPRTRTMADLLAEQGEFERALDIYTELWRATPPGPKRREIDELRGRMAEELNRRERGKPAAGRKKEKDDLLLVLDGLAKRLEVRSS
jgi:tetratricopeptide (TPR) repeat protein